MTKRASQQAKRAERQLDETVADSFPASDPAAHSGITGVRRNHKGGTQDATARAASHKRGHDERPTGQPSWDRHATETAQSWEDEEPSAA